jgi:alkylation response protein AidB-like acyl-CoA dehydrogenase
VPSHHVLTDRFLELCADVRPAFLILQTAIALGIADTALEHAAPRLQGTLTTFVDDHAALVTRLADLSDRHRGRAAAPGTADADLVQVRLEASEVAVAATRHESAVTGGAGYLATSPTARRLREAAFLPIQSPTEAQLRWELTRSA